MKEKNWLKRKTIIMVLAKTSVDQLESKDKATNQNTLRTYFLRTEK